MWSLLAALALASSADGVTVRLGVPIGAVRDDLLVPLGFGGPGLRVGVGWAGPAGPGWLVARVEPLGARVLWERFLHRAWMVDEGAEVRWTLPVRDRTWRVDLGPALVWDTRTYLLEPWDDCHAFWIASQWLGPAVRMRRTLRGGVDVEVAAAVAVAGLVGRPPDAGRVKQEPTSRVAYYLVDPHRGERPRTVDAFQAVRAEVGLVDDPWTWTVDARLTRAVLPAPAVDLGITLWAGRTWR